MNRKLLIPGAAGMAFAAGCIGVQAGWTGPVRPPVNKAVAAVFGDGLSAQAQVAGRNTRVGIGRPATDPTLNMVDNSLNFATSKAASTAGGAVDKTRATAGDAVSLAHAVALRLTGTVDHAAGAETTKSLSVPSPIGPARWNQQQLMQEKIRFDAGHATSHKVEVKAQKSSPQMYSLQTYVDDQPYGRQVSVYTTSLRLDALDVPVYVPAAAGTIDLAVSYGYFSSGSTCLASIGQGNACAAAAPDPEALARLRPEVIVDLGWQMLGRPAGSSSVRTPAF